MFILAHKKSLSTGIGFRLQQIHIQKRQPSIPLTNCNAHNPLLEQNPLTTHMPPNNRILDNPISPWSIVLIHIKFLNSPRHKMQVPRRNPSLSRLSVISTILTLGQFQWQTVINT